ncbi:amidohydrolase family protein [Deinococcus detaillensis]|uniref:Amidohydrolase family protein n=1 Tax=Deinococcus detaillensis TaxID=2592048 RepID=A0A553V2I9_9DEIO|nr:amidohydrolase family protein [Deinococcus detaillensis]TSA86688.1 amidohydrolase family protein [Deinococcus detaillensis]
MSELELIHADILYTGMGLPIRDGAVVMGGQTIAAAGDLDTLRRQYPQAELRRTVGVIAPPPVNAHAHLDMSDYAFQALPYFQWIPEVVIAGRLSRGLAGAKKGLAQVQQSGAAALGDIVWPGTPEVMDYLLSEAELGGVAYWEVLDPDPATAEATFAQVVQDVQRFRKLERPGGMRLGLSPHATHTVSHKLHRLLANFARREGLPLQIHVAEHPSEVELFQSGTGPLAESFARMISFTSPSLTLPEVLGRAPSSDLTPVSYLADLGVLDAKPTLIHMVNVTDEDIRTVAQAGANVVTCPRSNANLECGTFRWTAFVAAGVDVALGTDSVASGETLNIFDETLAARRIHANLDPRLIVRAAVKGGSRVLGTKVPFLRRGEAWSEGFIWPEA